MNTLAHKGTQTLCTERLTLRRYALCDAVSMYKNYATDERVTRFLSWEPYKRIEDVEAFLSSEMDEYQHQDKYHWAIELGGEVIGGISAVSIDESNHSCEIGYGIGYEFWNKGITSEALLAVMKFFFSEVGMHRIMAKHNIENPASGKVMMKCGMTYEGRLRGHYLQPDGTCTDSAIYGILKDEFVREMQHK